MFRGIDDRNSIVISTRAVVTVTDKRYQLSRPHDSLLVFIDDFDKHSFTVLHVQNCGASRELIFPKATEIISSRNIDDDAMYIALTPDDRDSARVG